MRVTTIEQVPATTRKSYTITCDLCGKDTEQKYGEVAETCVSCATGERYGSEGQYDKITFDVCVDCFKSKLVPWFAAQGVTPRESDCSW
jgi:hypothetical protein